MCQSDTDPCREILFSWTPVKEIKVQGELEEYLLSSWGFGVWLMDNSEGKVLVDMGHKNLMNMRLPVGRLPSHQATHTVFSSIVLAAQSRLFNWHFLEKTLFTNLPKLHTWTIYIYQCKIKGKQKNHLTSNQHARTLCSQILYDDFWGFMIFLFSVSYKYTCPAQPNPAENTLYLNIIISSSLTASAARGGSLGPQVLHKLWTGCGEKTTTYFWSYLLFQY